MRRQSRELALKLLFQSEFSEPLKMEDLLKTQDPHTEFAAEVQLYAKELVRGVQQNQADIDKLIQQFSSNWKIDRMATIDRNLLRVAIYELKFSPNPLAPSIAINEAIEIAKVYGGTDSSSFINGILDQVARGL